MNDRGRAAARAMLRKTDREIGATDARVEATLKREVDLVDGAINAASEDELMGFLADEGLTYADLQSLMEEQSLSNPQAAELADQMEQGMYLQGYTDFPGRAASGNKLYPIGKFVVAMLAIAVFVMILVLSVTQ